MAPELLAEPGGAINEHALDTLAQNKMDGNEDYLRVRDPGELAMAGLNSLRDGHGLPLLAAAVKHGDYQRNKDHDDLSFSIYQVKKNVTAQTEAMENQKRETADVKAEATRLNWENVRLKRDVARLESEVARLNMDAARRNSDIDALKRAVGWPPS